MRSQVVFEKINVPCNVSLLCGNCSWFRFNVSGSVLLSLGVWEFNIPLNLVLHLPNMLTHLETLRNIFCLWCWNWNRQLFQKWLSAYLFIFFINCARAIQEHKAWPQWLLANSIYFFHKIKVNLQFFYWYGVRSNIAIILTDITVVIFRISLSVIKKTSKISD